MTVRLSVLVKEKEMSDASMRELWRKGVFDVDSLYCLVRVALKPGNKYIAESVSRDLGIRPDNLASYMKFIESYVSERITNPGKYKGDSAGGCLFDEAQMDKLRRINSMSPEDYASHQQRLERKFWENREAMMRYGWIDELFGSTFDA